jgi:hypothetical protein
VADDIVVRLQQIAEQAQCDCSICETAWDAAETIKALRNAIIGLQAEVQRLEVVARA